MFCCIDVSPSTQDNLIEEVDGMSAFLKKTPILIYNAVIIMVVAMAREHGRSSVLARKKSILYVQTSDAPDRQYSPLVLACLCIEDP